MAISRVSQSTVKQGLDKSQTFKAGIPPILGRYYALASETVGVGGAASIQFTNIPPIYKHLQIRFMTRSAGSSSSRVNLNINGDTSSTAAWHSFYGTGAAVAGYTIGTAYIQVGSMPTSANTAGNFGVGVIDILDYSNSNKNKVVRSLGGHDLNGSGLVLLNSGARYNTEILTSITLTPNAAENFAQYSIASLYGVK